MSATKIQWTEATWNPVRGCSRISPGCENCYAERQAARFNGRCGALSEWTGKVELVLDMLDLPMRRKKPTTYDVSSMSDLFHESLPDEEIDEVFAVMAMCPQHMFRVQTKRADRMRKYALGIGTTSVRRRIDALIAGDVDWPLPNVWMGVSVENQKYADERIPLLLQTPAAVRFVSAEPLLGALDLYCYLPLAANCDSEGVHRLGTRCPDCGDVCNNDDRMNRHLDWVIVGGESGPGARPFDIAWARDIIRQCRVAGVAPFVKQLGSDPREGNRNGSGYVRLRLKDRKGGDMSEWPEDVRVRERPESSQ